MLDILTGLLVLSSIVLLPFGIIKIHTLKKMVQMFLFLLDKLPMENKDIRKVAFETKETDKLEFIKLLDNLDK